MYRSPSAATQVDEAYRRALTAYEALRVREPLLARANVTLVRYGERTLDIPEYAPPPPPEAAPEVGYMADRALLAHAQVLTDLTAYYAAEIARHDGALAAFAAAEYEGESPGLLAPAPRPVPRSYALVEFFRGYWLVLRFLLFPPLTMAAAIAALPIWYVHPALLASPLFPIGVYALVRYRTRMRYLSGGEVATIVARSQQTTFVSNKNVPKLHARGWRVEVRGFHGYTIENELTYRSSSGIMGKAYVRGPEFNGVLLCLPQQVDAALPNTAFACTPVPDARGQWKPGVSVRAWATTVAGIVLALAYLLLVVGLAVYDVRLPR